MPPRQWRQRLRRDGEGDSDSGPDADGTPRSQVRGGPRLESLPGRAVRAAGPRRDGRCALGRCARRVLRGHEVTDAPAQAAQVAQVLGTLSPRIRGGRDAGGDADACPREGTPASQAAPRRHGPGHGRGAWVRRTPELGWPVAAAWMRRRDTEGMSCASHRARVAPSAPRRQDKMLLYLGPDVQRRQTVARCPKTRAVAFL